MIEVVPVGGLCNRLRAVDSAIKFAEESRSKVEIRWLVNGELFAPFESLFDVGGFDWGKIAIRNQYRSSILYATFSERLLRNRDVVLLKDPKIRELRLNRPDSGRAVFLNLEHARILTCYRFFDNGNAYSWLKPASHVSQDKYVSVDRQCLGLHLRGTDRRRTHTDNTIVAALDLTDALLANGEFQTVYLATDEPDLKSVCAKKFGSRMCVSEASCGGRSSEIGMVDALRDAFSLSRTGLIVANTTSSFSRFCGQFGGVEVRNVAVELGFEEGYSHLFPLM